MKRIVTAKRIGIMGGTFDPIHYGHLMLAEQIRNSFYLDEIVFIPVGIPSHKSDDTGATKADRLKMTKLAIKSNPYFTVSDIEIRRDKPTYTIDTLTELKNSIYAHDALFFITGADAILYLDKWKNYKELIHMVTFIGASRPGVDFDVLDDKLKALRRDGAQVEICHIPALAISSTDIRARIRNERSIKYLLPESVEHHIEKKGLYRPHHPQYAAMRRYLKRHLSPHRFEHSVATAQVARKLAYRHGECPENAEMAGLSHDYAKEFDNRETLALIDAFGIEREPCIVENPNLAHGEVAAVLLQRDGWIEETAILDAIRWHTYGHPEMSVLAKIIYLADIIEPSRNFEGVETIRHLAMENLNQAILEYIRQSTAFLGEAHKPMHKNAMRLKRTLLDEEAE